MTNSVVRLGLEQRRWQLQSLLVAKRLAGFTTVEGGIITDVYFVANI